MKVENTQWRNPLNTGMRREETPQQKRLQQMQESLKRLQEMPTPKTSQKQAAAEKVAWLKRRLDSLKAMLLHATPEQAKALARELKSIAKELGSVAKSLSSGSESAALGPTVHNAGATGAESAGKDAEAAALRQAEAEAAQADVGESAETGGESATAAAAQVAAQQEDAKPGGRDEQKDAAMEVAADKSLRQLLAEARKLLKESINLLKAKLADAESRKDLQSAEKSLEEMDQALAQGGDSSLYTAQGEPGSDVAMAGSAEVGGSISVSV